MENIKNYFTDDTQATLGQLKQMIEGFENMGMTDDAKIPLTYIIQRMYPNVPENLKKNLAEVQREAYMEGLKEGRGH